ncbi:hypothetical protein EH155_15800 [Elizabethkingia anophelis]|nr:hypothetical protein [Elizabethkingia anophelis]
MTKTAKPNEEYPEFEHRANCIIKYAEAIDIFTLLLKNGSIIHFKPRDPHSFRLWLQQNNIPVI